MGSCVLAGAVLAFGAHLATVVVGARRRYPPTMFQVVAVPALGAVAALGAVLAVMLDRGAGGGFLTILAAKVVLAVGGWLGLIVVGVLAGGLLGTALAAGSGVVARLAGLALLVSALSVAAAAAAGLRGARGAAR